MADISKAERLAAARKMLKEFQQKKEPSPSVSPRIRGGPAIGNSGYTVKTVTDSGQEDIRNGPPPNIEPQITPSYPAIGQPNFGNGNPNLQNNNNVCSFFTNNVEKRSEEAHNFFDNLTESNGGRSHEGRSNEGSIILDGGRREEEIALREANTQLQVRLHQTEERLDEVEKRLHDESEKVVDLSRTISILVAEKTDLQRQLDSLQQEADKKKKENEEVSGRLAVSRGKVAELEREARIAAEARRQATSTIASLQSSLAQTQALAEKHKLDYDESEGERKEMARRFEAASQQLSSLNSELEITKNQLSMSHIKIQQLGGEVEGGEDEVGKLKEEVERLKSALGSAQTERDQMTSHYQQYTATLAAQLQDANSKYDGLMTERDILKEREESLVKHIADFEKQIQKQAAIEKRSEEPNDALAQLKEELDITLARIAELEAALEAKEKEVEEAKTEVQRIEEGKREAEKRLEESVPEARLLQAAMESDKLAASRAIQQNNQLKQQLDDMRHAFTTLSESKLELMEELEKEQASCSQLRKQLVIFSTRSTSEASTQYGSNCEHDHHSHQLVDGCSQTTYHDVHPHPPVTVEAMSMLEDKFRRTMDHLAQLSDEKQRLEHLVTQLQGETETIGEYIALYQAQRSLLERRAVEREAEVSGICKEKEALQAKLADLSQLIPHLLNKDGKEETAERIISLIGEIGTSSLVQHSPNIAFHPCPCCSGKLITV